MPLITSKVKINSPEDFDAFSIKLLGKFKKINIRITIKYLTLATISFLVLTCLTS